MTTTPFASSLTSPVTSTFTSIEPLIRVEKGSAGPAELAALTAVLLHRVAYDACAYDARQAPAPRWNRAGTRHAAGSPVSWRSAHLRDSARRPWQR
ncbi:acyl-CoA carboxylase subunit epsilon [Streptomyces coerulescens]|uniref:Acyl-CoA carboxylase subunit epsilon n=1 Tax=Streptomyces coerulescens TaxID=29304 RepID=A0ABW0CLR4_STRCD